MTTDTRTFTLMGMSMIVRVSADESGGAISVIEQRVPPGKGSPPHTIREDKTFVVLDGAFTFSCNGQATVAQKGDAVFIPRGAVHNFSNTSEGESTLIAIVTPGGHERFLRDLSAAGPALQGNKALFTEIADRHGVELK